MALVGIALCAATMRAQPTLEYEVKAGFLYNFTRYVDWPADAFEANGPFRICVTGKDPFGATIDHAVRGELVAGHRIEIVRAGTLDRCHLVFVPRTDDGRSAAVIGGLRSDAVLVVGEQPGFLAQGGTINFLIDGGRIRFDINTSARTAQRLTISSKLLRVAQSVSGTGSR